MTPNHNLYDDRWWERGMTAAAVAGSAVLWSLIALGFGMSGVAVVLGIGAVISVQIARWIGSAE